MNQKALYPYTLQPIALNMSQAEFQHAQLALFKQSSQTHGLKSLRSKEWIALGVITALAILGLVFVHGYSTILFWLMLVAVVIYLLLRTLGLKWYMQKEYEKQVANSPMPSEMSQIKIGIQPHGLVLSLPNKNHPSKQKQRGMMQNHMQSMAIQQAVIPWQAVTSWDETDEFIFILFDVKGQRGSQIIPKRLHGNGFSLDTIKSHLSEITSKGLKMDNLTTMP